MTATKENRPKAGLFVTCLVDVVRPEIGLAAARLLEMAGCEVVVPQTQTCCGQPAWNAGADNHARIIARQVIDAFADVDYVIVPSGSCAGTIKRHYPNILRGDTRYAQKAADLADRTYELTAFLVRVRGLKTLDAKQDMRISYHDSCSSLRDLGIRQEPRALLSGVTGTALCELKDSDVCCGFGGLFSVKYPEISTRMADNKLADAEAAGAETLVGNDLGCLIHLAGRAERKGTPIRTCHVAEFLVRALPGGETA